MATLGRVREGLQEEVTRAVPRKTRRIDPAEHSRHKHPRTGMRKSGYQEPCE